MKFHTRYLFFRFSPTPLPCTRIAPEEKRESRSPIIKLYFLNSRMDVKGTLRKIHGTFGCGCRFIDTVAIEVSRRHFRVPREWLTKSD